MEWALLPLKRYAQFSGRSRRKEFWLWVLFVLIVSIILSIVDKALGLGGATSVGADPLAPGTTGFNYGAAVRGGLLANLFALAVLVPNLAVAVRRLHDTDRTGWWLVVPLGLLLLGTALTFAAPPVGAILLLLGGIAAIALLVFYILPGTAGPNRFGPDPKGVDGTPPSPPSV